MGRWQRKDFGVEVTTLKYQFVGVGRTLSEDWIQARSRCSRCLGPAREGGRQVGRVILGGLALLSKT